MHACKDNFNLKIENEYNIVSTSACCFNKHDFLCYKLDSFIGLVLPLSNETITGMVPAVLMLFLAPNLKAKTFLRYFFSSGDAEKVFSGVTELRFYASIEIFHFNKVLFSS